MKKSLIGTGALLLALTVSAQAQPRNNNQRTGGGATLPLPQGVKSVISIDAFNILLAETERDGQRDIGATSIQHVYSGGIARLFGGSSVPTEQFVSPGALGGGIGGFGMNGANSGIGGIGGNTGIGSIGGNTGISGNTGIGSNTGVNGNTNFGDNTGFGGNTGFGAFQIRPFGRN